MDQVPFFVTLLPGILWTLLSTAILVYKLKAYRSAIEDMKLLRADDTPTLLYIAIRQLEQLRLLILVQYFFLLAGVVATVRPPPPSDGSLGTRVILMVLLFAAQLVSLQHARLLSNGRTIDRDSS